MMDEKPRDTECSGRRVMVTSNSDGQAYTLEEFIKHFGESVGLAEWQKASPMHTPSSHQTERRSAPGRDFEGVMEEEGAGVVRVVGTRN